MAGLSTINTKGNALRSLQALGRKKQGDKNKTEIACEQYWKHVGNPAKLLGITSHVIIDPFFAIC